MQPTRLRADVNGVGMVKLQLGDLILSDGLARGAVDVAVDDG
jgi:hypothetical protein